MWERVSTEYLPIVKTLRTQRFYWTLYLHQIWVSDYVAELNLLNNQLNTAQRPHSLLTCSFCDHMPVQTQTLILGMAKEKGLASHGERPNMLLRSEYKGTFLVVFSPVEISILKLMSWILITDKIWIYFFFFTISSLSVSSGLYLETLLQSSLPRVHSLFLTLHYFLLCWLVIYSCFWKLKYRSRTF